MYEYVNIRIPYYKETILKVQLVYYKGETSDNTNINYRSAIHHLREVDHTNSK